MSKKTIEITGKPLFPLTVGMTAVIREIICGTPYIRQTSPVEHIIEHPNGMIEVVTRNTVYHLTIADPTDTTVLGFAPLG